MAMLSSSVPSEDSYMSHDDDMDHRGEKKHRTIFSPEQKAALEAMFIENPFPDKKAREELATRIGVNNPKSVDYWFGHRRAKNRSRQRQQEEHQVPSVGMDDSQSDDTGEVPDMKRRHSYDDDEEFNHVMYGHSIYEEKHTPMRKPAPPHLVSSSQSSASSRSSSSSVTGHKRVAGDAFSRPENRSLEQLWVACLLNHFYLEPRQQQTAQQQQ
eukprot:EC726038.1.p1 GENE.EC726038.1~~EC726038.1.p1  ORF type:complete len:213 (+),score=42.54 EC726038.1:69-707(+)